MRTRDLLPAFADALKFDFGFPDSMDLDLDFGFGTKTKKQLEKVQEGFKVDPTTTQH